MTIGILKLWRHCIRALKSRFLRGEKFYCPVCSASYSRFYPAGIPQRKNARCPGCGSLERHRLLSIGIDSLYKQGILNKGGRLLHIAPETCLSSSLRENFDYLSIDMYADAVDVRADLTSLCFADETFDSVICNHVLEHVVDDRAALSELFRVLKCGGWGSIQVPLMGTTTQEDLTITDPVERALLYGQSDHVRQYGRDFMDRLEAAGFEAIQLMKENLLNPIELKRVSVDCEESVLLVRKPEGQPTSTCSAI